MNIVLYLVSETAAERLATRLFKDGFIITPTLNSGKYGAKLNTSYLVAFSMESPKDLSSKKHDEVFTVLKNMLVELDIAYFGGQFTHSGATTYFPGHMPKLPEKKLKPRNPLDNVLPFPKTPQPQPEPT